MEPSVGIRAILLAVTCVAVGEADYTFSIHFYEFRNPLGLQCGECESGGPPACCDDVQRRENCTNVRPFTCDTVFRFMLRPFGASVETAPVGFGGLTYATGGSFSDMDNSRTFLEGPGAFLALSNPFVISETGEWTGRTQFFIDAVDRANSGEREAFINHFPIDLELSPGPCFTERRTYTGIYSISGLGFDMSFRVQCSENYYGANCDTFCEPVEGRYICDSEGRILCLRVNHDPTNGCTTCLQGRDVDNNCATCLLPGYDPSTNCSQCLPGIQCEVTQELPKTTEASITSIVADLTSSITTQATLGGVLSVSLIINLILAIAVVVLLVKVKSTTNQSPPVTSCSKCSERESMDNIEMTPNELYGTSENITTKPNVVYGGIFPTESTNQPGIYKCM